MAYQAAGIRQNKRGEAKTSRAINAVMDLQNIFGLPLRRLCPRWRFMSPLIPANHRISALLIDRDRVDG